MAARAAATVTVWPTVPGVVLRSSATQVRMPMGSSSMVTMAKTPMARVQMPVQLVVVGVAGGMWFLSVGVGSWAGVGGCAWAGFLGWGVGV